MANYKHFFLCLIAATLISCSHRIGTETIALNKQQIDTFILNKEIKDTAIKNIDGRITVITFEQEDEAGLYVVYELNGEIESAGMYYSNKVSMDKLPDVRTSGISTGIPFVTLSITNKELINQTEKVEVLWNDGHRSVENLNNQSSIIIPYKENTQNAEKSYFEILFMDSNGDTIHEIN